MPNAGNLSNIGISKDAKTNHLMMSVMDFVLLMCVLRHLRLSIAGPMNVSLSNLSLTLERERLTSEREHKTEKKNLICLCPIQSSPSAEKREERKGPHHNTSQGM